MDLLELPLGRETAFDFLAALRKNSAIPALLMSSAGTKALVIARLRARAGDYIQNPFTEDDLLARVQALLPHGHHPGDLAERTHHFIDQHFAGDWTMASLVKKLTLSVRTMGEGFCRRNIARCWSFSRRSA